MNELACFAGFGGGLLASELLGWRTICAVERDAYAASILVQRQNDGILRPFPIWPDIRDFDGRPWRGIADVVSGGFPCVDISIAGTGAGIDGEDSGLWREMARVIGEVRPRFAFVENSPLLVGRGLARILGDLADMGFDAVWGCVGAHHLSAPHKRERIWIVATNTDDAAEHDLAVHGAVASQPQHGEASLEDAVGAGLEERAQPGEGQRERRQQADRTAGATLQQAWVERCGAQWASDAGILRVADGTAHRVERIRCIGNAQVPCVAAFAFQLLTEDFR